jgi:hypothetical protein
MDAGIIHEYVRGLKLADAGAKHSCMAAIARDGALQECWAFMWRFGLMNGDMLALFLRFGVDWDESTRRIGNPIMRAFCVDSIREQTRGGGVTVFESDYCGPLLRHVSVCFSPPVVGPDMAFVESLLSARQDLCTATYDGKNIIQWLCVPRSTYYKPYIDTLIAYGGTRYIKDPAEMFNDAKTLPLLQELVDSDKIALPDLEKCTDRAALGVTLVRMFQRASCKKTSFAVVRDDYEKRRRGERSTYFALSPVLRRTCLRVSPRSLQNRIRAFLLFHEDTSYEAPLSS